MNIDLTKGLFLFARIFLSGCHNIDGIRVDNTSHSSHSAHLVVVTSPLVVVPPVISIVVSSPSHIIRVAPIVGTRVGIVPIVATPPATTTTVSPGAVRIDGSRHKSTSSEIVRIGISIIIVYSSPNIVTVVNGLVWNLVKWETAFEDIVAFDNDIDLYKCLVTRLLDGCQFLQELSF